LAAFTTKRDGIMSAEAWSILAQPRPPRPD
jgi:hypothetical protein